MLELASTFPFRIVDYHLHTISWSDGRLQLPELLRIAQEKGYRIGISDHAGPKQGGIQAHNVDAYLNELAGSSVYRGIEMDLAYGLTFPVEKLTELDYVIASLHGWMREGEFVAMDGVFRWFQVGGEYRPDLDLSDPEVWVEEWFSVLERCFAVTAVDILGHPTLTPILPLDPNPERAYRPEWEERLCELLLKHDVALEISGRYKLPHKRLLHTAKEMGVLFAIGSDGHQRQQICDLTYPLEMIQQVGISAEQIFDVEQKRQR